MPDEVIAPRTEAPETPTGRIIGEYFAYIAPRDALPTDAASLPEGCERRFEEGQFFRLFIRGFKMGDRQGRPELGEFEEMIIEAGQDGVVLRGPAVFAPYEAPERLLRRIVVGADGVHGAFDWQHEAISKMPSIRRVGIQWLLTMIGVVAIIALIAGWRVYNLPGEARTQLLGVLAWGSLIGLAVVLLLVLSDFRGERRRCLSDMKRMWSRLPDRAKTGDLARDILLVDPDLGTEDELTPVEPPRGKVVPAIPLKLQLACARFCLLRSANFIPAQ